jgi:uncharacterized membrane protein
VSLIRRIFTADALRTTLAALLIGGILHLCTTFVLARVGATQPFGRMTANLPVNEMRLLAPVTPKTQTLPFEAADALSAACAFDASTGPVVIRAVLAGPGWTLALYSPTGTNFYSIAGQDGRRGDIQLMLVPAGDEFVPMPRDPSGLQARILQISLPSKVGLAVIRAPLPGQAWRSEVEADLKLASCALKKK